MAQNVKFIAVKLQATYDTLATKDPLALYWIHDTQRVYKGDKLFGVGIEATTEFAGLMSAADKAALEALKAGASTGISNLVPVDGTISITDSADGGKAIGVLVSNNTNNALVATSQGLFVPTVSVPEYTIEKQAVAEDGYVASYKLKKTADGVESYVGDTINVAKDMVLQSATLEVVTENNVPYTGAVVGDPYIKMVFNDANMSNLYIPVKGLVDKYQAGSGIAIDNNVVSVKLADNTHGLVAVDGALSINLATRTTDGAMSAKDKLVVDSIPSVYVARKYDIANTPTGTLVNYGEKEIRIMCPTNAEFTKQNVGVGGDPNAYYMTFKTYAPNDHAVGYVEHLNGKSDSEVLTTFSMDEYGRRYQPTWLALAKYDEVLGKWAYYGKNSSTNKYIGWDYRIDWYDANGIVIATDSIRINLSNEECHYSTIPYYVSNFATTGEVEELRESIADLTEAHTWVDM